MEHETFWTLLRDPAHWEFELLLIFIFDVLIGLIIWPHLRGFLKHHKGDDAKIEKLEKEVADLKNRIGMS